MNQASTITVRVNGEARALACHTTVARLLEELGHIGRCIAVERNGDFVKATDTIARYSVTGSLRTTEEWLVGRLRQACLPLRNAVRYPRHDRSSGGAIAGLAPHPSRERRRMHA